MCIVKVCVKRSLKFTAAVFINQTSFGECEAEETFVQAAGKVEERMRLELEKKRAFERCGEFCERLLWLKMRKTRL